MWGPWLELRFKPRRSFLQKTINRCEQERIPFDLSCTAKAVSHSPRIIIQQVR